MCRSCRTRLHQPLVCSSLQVSLPRSLWTDVGACGKASFSRVCSTTKGSVLSSTPGPPAATGSPSASVGLPPRDARAPLDVAARVILSVHGSSERQLAAMAGGCGWQEDGPRGGGAGCRHPVPDAVRPGVGLCGECLWSQYEVSSLFRGALPYLPWRERGVMATDLPQVSAAHHRCCQLCGLLQATSEIQLIAALLFRPFSNGCARAQGKTCSDNLGRTSHDKVVAGKSHRSCARCQ